MNKQDGAFVKKVTAFITSFAFIAGAAGISVALAAITFSGTSITGDSSFTNVTGVVSSTWDFGAGTLSLQTASNSPITAGSGLFTVGGKFTAATSTITGLESVGLFNVTGTSVFGGVATLNAGITQSGGLVSLASTTVTGLFSSSLFNSTGTSVFGGLATFNAGITQSGGLVSLASTTVAGNATTTNLTITALGGAAGCLSVSASGAVTTSTCGNNIGNVSVTAASTLANYFPFWITAASSTVSATSSIFQSGLSIGIGTTQPSSTLHVIGGGFTQSGGVNSLATTTVTGLATMNILNVTSTSVHGGLATFNAGITQSGGLVSLASTTVTGLFSSSLFNSTGTATFKGNLNVTSTNADTVGTCGTSPTIVGGNGRGAATTGNNASSTCTVTFGLAFTNKPLCQVTSETTSSINYQITPSASTLVITVASSSAFVSNTLDYFCWGQ